MALFAAAAAGVPLVPLNYRLPAEQLVDLVAQNEPAYVVADAWLHAALALPAERLVTPERWLELTEGGDGDADGLPGVSDPDDVALLLYTSGTTAAPKAAVLRHRNLASYVLSTIDFQSADEDEASLVSVPPYHIAGVANTVSNLYAGRRVIHLPAPALRTLAYGGAAMPSRVIGRALELFPDTGFVNAYGLTETSSTIALLGPDDHRAAAASTDPAVQARLGSAGRAVPGIELVIRDAAGAAQPAGVVGDLWVRGDQVSGEYRGRSDGPVDGWFSTRDRAWLDADSFLFLEGRSDDTIIRGGENIAPAEIEHVLQLHPGVSDVAVVGLPDEEWGQRIAAAVVPRAAVTLDEGELQAWVRARLRGSKTPDLVVLVADLPRTDTGKILRRQVQVDLTPAPLTPESVL